MAVAEAGAAAAAGCAHCGLPVPAARLGAGDAPPFCCEGCQAVFALLHEHGLERYYAVRAATEAAALPARSTGRSYEELDDAGVRARIGGVDAAGLATAELYLEGVHCAACVWLVERLPQLAPGVVESRLDLGRARATVVWDPRATPLSRIAATLDSLGYRPHPARGVAEETARRREERRMLARIGVAGAVAANVMAIAFALYGGILDGIEAEFADFFRWMSLGLTIPSLVWCGGVFFVGAWRGLRQGKLHMDLPISIGLAAGFAHGATATVRGTGDVYFDTITVLIFLLLSGRYLLRRQHRTAAAATELLAGLAPSVARRIDATGVREVPAEALVPGDRVEVRTGELVPADGRVAAGRSALDMALLTGESRPVDVGPGDVVHAGVLNVASRLEVSVERTGDETRVGRLARLVEEHARRRAPIVLFADRLAGVFVTVVLALAGITAAIWWPSSPGHAIESAVALLIVTCPCALALATPLAVSAAIGRAARAGLLIKGADVLERLATPGVMLFDKTGTLTTGRPELVSWWGSTAVRPLVAALEAQSAHPLAQSLAAALAADDAPARVSHAGEVPGGGVEGDMEGHHVIVGSPRFVASRGARVPGAAVGEMERLAVDGRTPVVIAMDGTVVAVAGLGDTLRPGAADALAGIHARGWEVGILSGDHPAVVAGVARQLGLDPSRCLGNLTPEAKLKHVQDARSRGPVVMVGDGINDAAALAAASVGVGVHGGAEVVLTTADVFVTRPGLGPIVDLLEGARRTLRVIRRNLIFSLLYNAIAVALAMSGRLDPVAAAILMPLSSITVIVSSFRARTFEAPAASPGAGERR